jgi:hypothetical protein
MTLRISMHHALMIGQMTRHGQRSFIGPPTLERSTAIADDDAFTDAQAALYGGAGRKP